jgi:hypothetical protein
MLVEIVQRKRGMKRLKGILPGFKSGISTPRNCDSRFRE